MIIKFAAFIALAIFVVNVIIDNVETGSRVGINSNQASQLAELER